MVDFTFCAWCAQRSTTTVGTWSTMSVVTQATNLFNVNTVRKLSMQQATCVSTSESIQVINLLSADFVRNHFMSNPNWTTMKGFTLGKSHSSANTAQWPLPEKTKWFCTFWHTQVNRGISVSTVPRNWHRNQPWITTSEFTQGKSHLSVLFAQKPSTKSAIWMPMWEHTLGRNNLNVINAPNSLRGKENSLSILKLIQSRNLLTVKVIDNEWIWK